MPVVPAAALRFAELPGRRSADPLPADLGDACSARIVQVPPGPRSPHRHPHSAEVVYVARGEGFAWEEGSRTAVRAGDVVVVPAGAAHATLARSEPGLLLVCFFPHPDLSANVEDLEDVLDPRSW